jgi:hypothetical protein
VEQVARDYAQGHAETEAFWLELSGRLDYDRIEFLIRKTPKGALPGDVFEEPERATSELRCVLAEEVLDGWCCSTPGCPHKIRLHLHHLIPYSQGGPTLPHNVCGLCVACHGNVHAGSLRIFQTKDGKLTFTDADGNSLARQADLELARWLDSCQGWEGDQDDSYSLRVRSGDWAVFDFCSS